MTSQRWKGVLSIFKLFFSPNICTWSRTHEFLTFVYRTLADPSDELPIAQWLWLSWLFSPPLHGCSRPRLRVLQLGRGRELIPPSPNGPWADGTVSGADVDNQGSVCLLASCSVRQKLWPNVPLTWQTIPHLTPATLPTVSLCWVCRSATDLHWVMKCAVLGKCHSCTELVWLQFDCLKHMQYMPNQAQPRIIFHSVISLMH